MTIRPHVRDCLYAFEKDFTYLPYNPLGYWRDMMPMRINTSVIQPNQDWLIVEDLFLLAKQALNESNPPKTTK